MLTNTLKIALLECEDSACCFCNIQEGCSRMRSECGMTMPMYIRELLGDDES